MKGWLLSLVVLSCIIPLVIVGGIMTRFMSKSSKDVEISYSAAGNVVDQTIVGIKTVRPFLSKIILIMWINEKVISSNLSLYVEI